MSLVCRSCVVYSGHWFLVTDTHTPPSYPPLVTCASLTPIIANSSSYRICVTYISAGTQQPPRQHVVEITHRCDLYAICINKHSLISHMICMPVNGLIFVLHLANSLITYHSLITHTIHTRYLLLIRLCLVIYMWSTPHHITYWTTIRYLLLIRSSLTWFVCRLMVWYLSFI